MEAMGTNGDAVRHRTVTPCARLTMMTRPRPARLPPVPTLVALVGVLLAGCGGSRAAPAGVMGGDGSGAAPSGAVAAAPTPQLTDWPEFGLDPQRHGASDRSTGITAANVGRLRRTTVALPGTVDSSPIYVHAVPIGGTRHDMIVATTSYGRTVAIDARSARILWTFTAAPSRSLVGTPQITNASPVAAGAWVWAASPDGHVHKLGLADGREAAGWPVAVTRAPRTEKITSSLNLDGRYLVVATGGYDGDYPPYQGHVMLLDRTSGRVVRFFSSLCANRRSLFAPASCSASDSAIWSRSGVVVEPGGRRLLLATGNGPYDGHTHLSDSVIELTVPGLSVRQVYTPRNQAQLSSSDTDLGSSSPVLLGSQLTMIAGKDGVMRLLRLERLNGRAPGGRRTTGGEIQTLPTPGGASLFTAPAVSQRGGRTLVFVSDFQGTGAYALRGGRLRAVWHNASAGTSPVAAGGLLYVYDPHRGAVRVYAPASGRPLAVLPGGPGHWNSPIVANGQLVVPQGDANDHSATGTLTIFSTR